MEKVIRIGMDTSKSVFQLHGVNESEKPVLRKKLRRQQVLAFFAKLAPIEVGLEACGAAHHWARELTALGHRARLVPPQYAKMFVKRGKNDAADAEAICEAMSRPSMRFVPIKSAEQQAAQMLLGTRDGLVRRRTQLSNRIRGNAAEFGLVAAKGLARLEPLLARIAADPGVPKLAKDMFAVLAQEYAELDARLAQAEARLTAWHRQSELSRRLAEVPCIGPVGATAMTIKVTDPRVFGCGRDFSAWIGLTAKDHSTAGKLRLGGITRAGDEMLRSILVAGATAVIQQVKRGRARPSPWLAALLQRKPLKLAAVALANKTSRIAWKLMVSGGRYDPSHGRRGLVAPLARQGEPTEGAVVIGA